MHSQKAFRIYVLFLILNIIFLFTYIGNPLKVAVAVGDSYNQNFPTLVFNSDFKLWNPYIQTGKSSVIDLQGSALYPLILIISVFKNKVIGFNFYVLIQISLAGFFMYLFLKSLKRSEIAAILGGMVLCFGGFYSAEMGRISFISAMMWLPLTLFFINSYFKDKNKKYLFFAGFSIAMSVLAGDPAFVLYSSLVILPYIIFSILIEDKRTFFKVFFTIVSTIYATAILLSSILIIPALNSFNALSRTKNFWENFSEEPFNPVQILTFCFPVGLGGAGYFGRGAQQFSLVIDEAETFSYFGLMPFLLYLSCFFYKFKNKYMNFWKFLSLFFFVLMLGSYTPLWRFIYKYVPGFNLFNISSRYNSVFLFCAAAVFAYVLDEYILRILDFKSFFKYFSFPIFSFLILLLSATSFFGNFFRKVFLKIFKILLLRDGDINLFKNFKVANSALVIPIIIFFVFIIFFYLYFLCKKNKKLFNCGLILLVFLDLFMINSFFGKAGYLNIDIENKNFSIFKNIDAKIDAGNFRIFSTNATAYPINPEQRFVPDINMLYKIPSLNGYGSIIYGDFSTITGLEANGKYFYDGGAEISEEMLANPAILGKEDAVKYIYTSDSDIGDFLSNFKFKDYFYKKENVVYSLMEKTIILTLANSEIEGKEIKLKGEPTIYNYSIAQISVKLEKNCDYLISVEAYSKNPKEVNSWLISDIIDNKEYSAKKTIYIHPFEISTKPMIFNRVINTGDLGENTLFRVVSDSEEPIFIKSFSLTKVVKVYKNEKEISPYVKVYQEDGFYIYENLLAEKRAQIYTKAAVYQNLEDYKNALYGYEKNYDTLYFQGQVPLNNSAINSSGTILNSEYGEDKVVFKVQNEGQIFFELKDYYDKEWKCYVDGKETKIYKVNGIFRGIIIEESGTHTIVFKYVPITFYIGLVFTVLTTAFILLFVAKRRKGEAKTPRMIVNTEGRRE